MAPCKLCRERAADKKNTHYLTDGIIRSCLNEDGSNTREKAMMFNISWNKDSIEAKFQRSTSIDAIQRTFGREAKEEEIEGAKSIPFSVDYVFCVACETIFTEIENKFTKDVLPQLRGNDFTGQKEISFEDIVTIRKFFLLQVYRTAICDPDYPIDNALIEKLRDIILTKDDDPEVLKSIPLNITYLNTVGKDYEYTKNTVGIAVVGNNKVILLNDFVIQVFENIKDVAFVDLWGINERSDFKHFINYGEDIFRIKILDNKQRLQVWDKYHQERADKQVSFYKRTFTVSYLKKHHRPPAPKLVRAFIDAIINY
ncbi:MAG: hypothetical protein JWM28_1946 [Chitinophagaceae bacterium]|nr:hypothetical protein [Chitinophagaceae bacterium]